MTGLRSGGHDRTAASITTTPSSSCWRSTRCVSVARDWLPAPAPTSVTDLPDWLPLLAWWISTNEQPSLEA